MKTQTTGPLHVLDSSVWISLIEWHPELLYKLDELARLSVIEIGVPETVHLELNRHDPKRLDARKKDWEKRVGELQRFAHLHARTEDPFGPGETESAGFLSTLERMKKAIQEYNGDPNQDIVVRLLDSKSVTRILTPRAIHAQVIEHGISKKKPFAGKNGTADAAILFSALRWARRHIERKVYFHTLNYSDFSDPNTRKDPHPDIAEHFAPNTNVHYCADLHTLAESVKGMDPLDFVHRDPDGCTICEGKVLIDSISCMACGSWPSSVPDDEGYTLKSYRGGYLVDVRPYECEPYRLECDACGRKTFEVYLDDLCSYHQHTLSKE